MRTGRTGSHWALSLQEMDAQATGPQAAWALSPALAGVLALPLTALAAGLGSELPARIPRPVSGLA